MKITIRQLKGLIREALRGNGNDGATWAINDPEALHISDRGRTRSSSVIDHTNFTDSHEAAAYLVGMADAASGVDPDRFEAAIAVLTRELGRQISREIEQLSYSLAQPSSADRNQRTHWINMAKLKRLLGLN